MLIFYINLAQVGQSMHRTIDMVYNCRYNVFSIGCTVDTTYYRFGALSIWCTVYVAYHQFRILPIFLSTIYLSISTVTTSTYSDCRYYEVDPRNTKIYTIIC